MRGINSNSSVNWASQVGFKLSHLGFGLFSVELFSSQVGFGFVSYGFSGHFGLSCFQVRWSSSSGYSGSGGLRIEFILGQVRFGFRVGLVLGSSQVQVRFLLV